MAGGIATTAGLTAYPVSDMILGKDGNRMELTIYNLSETDFVYIGFGTELQEFTTKNSLPLAPGEAYDATTPPLNAVHLLSKEGPVDVVVYTSTTSPGYVKGSLYG